MTPMVEAKSGMVTTCDSSPAMIVPLKMPARATPMGRPMASTEPKAMIRMMMAKPMPSASDDGTSNSAKACPAELDPEAFDVRHGLPDLAPYLRGLLEGGVEGSLDLGEGDLPGRLGDLALAAGCVRAA